MQSVQKKQKERDDAAALEKAKADAQAKISQQKKNPKYANQKMYFVYKKKEQVAAAATLMIEEQTS